MNRLVAKWKCFIFLSLHFFNVLNLIYLVISGLLLPALKILDENLTLSFIKKKKYI